jgi:GNAT superfamily N-acetyltransferase
VRSAGAHDLNHVLEVLAENESHQPRADARTRDGRVSGPSEKQLAMWERIQATPDVTVLVGEIGNDVVGTGCLLVLPNITYDCRPTAFIEAVVVKYEHRRRGVATSILTQALADARRAGCHKVQLLTHKRHASDGAHDLYRTLGFVDEAEGFRLFL